MYIALLYDMIISLSYNSTIITNQDTFPVQQLPWLSWMVNPNTYIIIYFTNLLIATLVLPDYINYSTASLVLPVNTISLSDLNTFDTDLRSKHHHVFLVVFEDMTATHMSVYEDITNTYMYI